jgi:hypothetical protein
MVRTAHVLGAAALALVLALPVTTVDAQTSPNPTLHARAKHKTPKPKPEGRQITVHKATPSWLTLGGVSSPAVTSTNNYVLDTFNAPTPIQGTFLQGRTTVLDNRFDGPGVPLFRF